MFHLLIIIAQAILENTSESLARRLFSSPSALNRLAKKLGHKGYAELRIHFAIGYQVRPSQELSGNDVAAELLVHRLPELYASVLQRNRDILLRNERMLQDIGECLAQIDVIDIYATGSNYYFAHAMTGKFIASGYETHVSNYVDLDYLHHIDAQKHLAIILSRTGENPSCLYAAQQNAGIKVKTLAISRENATVLARFCDYALFAWIPGDGDPDKHIIQNISLNYIFDFLSQHTQTRPHLYV